MSSIRLLATRVISEVSAGTSLTDSLTVALKTIKDSRDQAFLQALCYEVCRFYPRLDYVLQLLLAKPLRVKEREIHALLLVGLCQLMIMQIPPHAAVTETVKVAKTLKKPWAVGLIKVGIL